MSSSRGTERDGAGPGGGAPSASPGDAPDGEPPEGGMVTAFRCAEQLLEHRRPLDALKALAPLLEAESDAASVHLLAARAYLASAQFRRAEAAFLRVLEIDPADHYARFALGRTLQRQSRLEEARAQLRMAAAMTPRPEYQEALGEVSASIAVRRGA
jgi:tetratricopeptide (TPR) repeat protein